LDSLDNVPDVLKAEYVEVTTDGPNKGKFALDVADDVKLHPKVQNLSNTLEKFKVKQKALEGELAAAKAKVEGLPEDFTPEKFLELSVHAPGEDGQKPKLDEQIQSQKRTYESRIKALEDKAKAEAEKLKATIAELEGENTTLVVDDSLRKALIEAGVDKTFLKAATAMLKPSAKAIKDEETKARRGVVVTDLGEEPIPEFINKWVQGDEGRVFVKTPSGGGAGGSTPNMNGAKNPWSKEYENLTEQSLLIKSNAARARQLASAAGAPINF
jgi:hypothetical protein